MDFRHCKLNPVYCLSRSEIPVFIFLVGISLFIDAQVGRADLHLCAIRNELWKTNDAQTRNVTAPAALAA